MVDVLGLTLSTPAFWLVAMFVWSLVLVLMLDQSGTDGGFVVSMLALGALALSVVDVPWLSIGFPDQVAGIPLALPGPGTAAAVLALGIVAAWLFDIRFVNGTSGADRVADRMRRRTEDVAEDYFGVGRAAAFAGFAIVSVLLSQAGHLLGDVFNLVGEAPVLVSQAVTGLLVWVGLGGSLPGVGTLGPFPTNVLVGAVIAVSIAGIAWRYA